MNRFREEEILRFFDVLNQKLTSKEKLFLIGGAAVLLNKHTGRMTKDVDTWMSVSPEILKFWPEVVKETGIELTIESSSVAEAAIEMEERSVSKIQLSNLTIITPSDLDLIIMKLQRFSDTDQADIYALAKDVNPESLLNVFKNEFLPYCTGSKRLVTITYLEVIENAFGVKIATKQEAQLKDSKP